MKLKRSLFLLFLSSLLLGVPMELGVRAAEDEGEAPAEESTSLLPAPSKKSSVSGVSESRAEKQKIRLTTGENRTVDIDFEIARPDQQISIGNPQIVGYTKATIQGQTQIVFNPLKPGETTVTLRDGDGKIKVLYSVIITASNLQRRKEELSGLLKDIEGIEIKIVGQRIVIDGEILVPNDYARMLGVVQDDQYSKVVLNLVTVSPLAMQVLSQKIKSEVSSFAPDVSTRVVNGMIFLEGSVSNGDFARRAEQVARLYLPEVIPGNALGQRLGDAAKRLDRPTVQNFIVVNKPPEKPQDKLIRVTFHFVKLAKDYDRFFGFKWQPLIGGADARIAVGTDAQGAPGASSSSFAATINNLLPKLQSAQSAGYARVLKTGTVIVRSGEKATFSEKGKIPFNSFNAQGQPVPQEASVGVEFVVRPKVIGQTESVTLDMDLTQVSANGIPQTGAAPKTTEHKIQTIMYVKSTDTAAVGGISSEDVDTGFNRSPSGVPDSGDFLFNLNRSKNYVKSKSQFVIFVTPQLIQDAAESTEDLKKNFRVKGK